MRRVEELVVLWMRDTQGIPVEWTRDCIEHPKNRPDVSFSINCNKLYYKYLRR